MATFLTVIEATAEIKAEVVPRVLIVGAGHAGGSVAAMAVAAGLPTSIWSRRPLMQLSPDLQALCQLERSGGGSRLAHRQVQWWDHGSDELREDLADVDWVVLADEPRDTACSVSEIERFGELAAQRYRSLLSFGFDEPQHSVVRIGSPAGESPDPGFPGSARLRYVQLKQTLLARATDAVDEGLQLATVAPGEIHSGFSSYQADPYRLALAGLERLPALHDFGVAAVSDRSLGEAVLLTAATAAPGAWYEVADGTLGPGRVLQMMARHLDRPLPPALVEWSPHGARHLFDVLEHDQPLSLDVIAAETEGWESEIDSLQSVRNSQDTLIDSGLWWAGSGVQEQVRRMTATAWGDALGALTRGVSQQVSSEMLGVMLALGAERSSDGIDGLARQLRSRHPLLAGRIVAAEQPSEVERARRLVDAVARQAARSSM